MQQGRPVQAAVRRSEPSRQLTDELLAGHDGSVGRQAAHQRHDLDVAHPSIAAAETTASTELPDDSARICPSRIV